MSEVRVIARSVARRGSENQLRELLRGMIAPTRAESGCKLYELYESDSEGRFYFHEIWESQAALINTQQVLTSSTWNEPWGD
jgi:quinol monooxygenase YgiN